MSDESEPATLPQEDDICDLPEEHEEHEDEEKEETLAVLVTLVSLNASFNDIALKGSKTILGRSKGSVNVLQKCSEGAVLTGSKISGTHCEVSSRSMKDPGAAIWIKDVSSNGVWVNEARIAKDEPVKIYHRDIISFVPGPVKNMADSPTFMLVDKRNGKRPNEEVDIGASVEEPAPESKKLKTDDGSAVDKQKDKENEKAKEDSAFEKEFECGICHDIMHKALVLQPCLHSFCKECCKAWLSNSHFCPSCRQDVIRTKRDFKLNNLIALFLETRPHLRRDEDEDEGAASDTSDILNTRSSVRRRRNRDDYDDDDDDYSDEDDVYQPDPNFPLANLNGLPEACACCDPANNLGFVCPDGVRLSPLPDGATYADYLTRRQVQPGHTQCQDCRTHLPIIPATAQDSMADRFRCKMCHSARCGCRMQSVDDRIAGNASTAGFLNRFEDSVIANYLAQENLTDRNIWEEIKTGMNDGTFHYLIPSEANARVVESAVGSSDKVCQDCARHFFANGPLYQWRKNLDPTKLPHDVTSREACWWGRECRTQYNPTNPAHAERRNHICEKRRRN